MFRYTRASAALFVLSMLSSTPAFAHAVCGDRIFPATLGIDDPGVGDELALPTVTVNPAQPNGQQEYDATFSWTKTIFPGFGISVQDGPSWVTSNSQGQGAYGWGDLSTEAKYNFLCIPDHEFMASVGHNGRLGLYGLERQRQREHLHDDLARHSTSAKVSATCPAASTF